MQKQRLAAIMFTDIVGYTSLMEKDNEKALDLLEENRQIQKPEIIKFEGEWIKEIGDATLSLFNSASAAVRCAKSILEKSNQVEGLTLRIGIHLGEVNVEENDVLGDGVNVASRIQEEAEPGTIFISGGVADSVKNLSDVDLTEIGKRKLKNIKKPVELFCLFPGREMDFAIKPSRKRVPYTLYLVLVLFIASTLIYIYQKVFSEPSELTPLSPSEIVLAVIPFEQMYEDSTEAYLGQMISDEIREQLLRYSGLTVLMEETSSQMAGMASIEIRKNDIATHLIRGNYSRQDNDLFINILIEELATGQMVELKRQKCDLENLNIAVTRITKNITQALNIQNIILEKEVFEKPPVQNDAYLLFQQGKYLLYKYQAQSLTKAISLFTEAIKLDPGFSEAYAARAYTYLMSAIWLGNEDQIVAISHATSDIDSALSIDINESMGYEAQAFLYNTFLWNRKDAETNFLKAQALNNGIPPMEYGSLLWQIRKYEESVRSHEKLIEYDPLNIAVYAELGLAYYLAGRKREAFYMYEKGLIMEPDNPLLNHVIAQLYLLENDYDKAREFGKKTTETSPPGFWPFHVFIDGTIYAREGDLENTMKTMEKMDEFERMGLKGMVGFSGAKFLWFVLLNDRGKAMQAFREAVRIREINLSTYDAWLDLYDIGEFRNEEYTTLLRESGLLYE